MQVFAIACRVSIHIDSLDEDANPVDANVGAVVRARRRSLGMSQGKLGQALGINLQQVQKNESGTNRLGASRLQQLSNILDVPVAYFF
jgi:transcriptional regulator with XRE-family HTH domain